MTRHAAVTAVLFAAVVGALAALAALLLSAGPAQAVQERPAPSAEVQTPAPAQTAPVAALEPADEAFLADLFGPATDYTPEQAEALTQMGRRIAALLSDPSSVPPGAEVPTRDGIMATLTLPEPSLTTGYSADEAGKIIDCALAAYAPPAV